MHENSIYSLYHFSYDIFGSVVWDNLPHLSWVSSGYVRLFFPCKIKSKATAFSFPSSGILSKIIYIFRKMETPKLSTNHLKPTYQYVNDYFQAPKLNRNEIQFLSPFRYDSEKVLWIGILNLDEVKTERDYAEVYDEVLRIALDEVDRFMREVIRKKLELFEERNPSIRKYGKREKGIRFFSNVTLRDIEIWVDDYELREWREGKYFGRSTSTIFSS